MKTMNFEQMEIVSGGSLWSLLNPIPTNGCEYALGGVAGVYGTAASVFLTPLRGVLFTVALMALANATCQAGMS